MTAPPKKIAILGGGITGLSAALALQEQARRDRAPVSVTLLEAEPRLGGKITTRIDEGFVIEGGPDSFISQKPWALELCQKLGLDHRLVGTNRDKTATYILHHGRLVHLPEGVMLLVPTRLWPFVTTPLFSPLGKIRMGLDWVIPARRGGGDESLAGFVRRRLGQEAVERLAEPLLAGIYAGDAEQMSLEATFPQFLEMERRHGSLIRGMLARRRAMRSASTPPPSGARTMFMTLKGGLSELVDAIASRLEPGTVTNGRAARRLHYRAGLKRFEILMEDGERLSADAVIAACPAYALADLLSETDVTLGKFLLDIPYVSTATVSLAFPKARVRHPMNGFGFVVPRREGMGLMACTWTSTKFPHRAPGDFVLVRCFVGGAGRESAAELDDQELVQQVRRDLGAIMGLSEPPEQSWVYRW